MKPLIVLLIASGISLLIQRFIYGAIKFRKAARIGMSIMLLFTAAGHFMFPQGMALMIPNPVPYKVALVYVTAILEILAAIGLQITNLRKITGWLLILFFILVLPANVNAAIHHLDYQTATYSGPGLKYLWFRIPLQIFFILWVYFSSIKNKQ